MKNYIFIFMLLCTSISLSAQSFRKEGEIYGGLKAGGNFSKIMGFKLPDPSKFDSIGKISSLEETFESASNEVLNQGTRYGFGFQAGGFVGYHISEDFAIQLETLYSSRNTKSPTYKIEEIANLEGSISARNNYIDIPILAKYYPIDNFYITAGPQLSFALSSSTTPNLKGLNANNLNRINYFIDNNNDIRKQDKTNIKQAISEGLDKASSEINKRRDVPKENRNTFNFAGIIGAGYELNENFSLDARYIYGFTNVYKKNDILPKSKDSMFQLGVAYSF